MLAGVVLDIREGQTVPKLTVFFFLGGGGFLTFGKVNSANIDRFFFGKKKQKKTQRKIGAKIDRFSGGGGVQI